MRSFVLRARGVLGEFLMLLINWTNLIFSQVIDAGFWRKGKLTVALRRSFCSLCKSLVAKAEKMILFALISGWFEVISHGNTVLQKDIEIKVRRLYFLWFRFLSFSLCRSCFFPWSYVPCEFLLIMDHEIDRDLQECPLCM